MSGERRRPVYLFTDIDGSTERWERAPSQMKAALARHDEIIDRIVVANGGIVKDHAGDGVFALFEGDGGLRCALEIQLALQHEDWGPIGGLPVRIGMHASSARAGESAEQVSINRAARITASAWGGQIVISADGADMCALPPASALHDLGFCRLRGINEPLQLYGLADPGLQRSDFPLLRSASMQAWAAPASSTPFFGRERECTEISELLEADETRWVTIVGPGGNGKTRLATRIASVFSERSSVWYVALDGATDGESLAATIARSMKLPLHGAGKQDEQLIAYLRDRSGLLVLDNAENVVGEAELVRSVVRECPDVRLLATSRFQFRTPEETAYRLGGFDPPSAESLRTEPAYQLFMHEARAARRDFEVKEVDPFIRLCALLAGSPLALRMAAQWSNMFSLREIVERVEAGLDFLAAQRKGEPERHSSLRSVFNGSWALLSPEEQRALARLAIFVGGFDACAAEKVADVAPNLVLGLEAKGLVEQTRRARFQLHPLIREYALEKLVERKADERLVSGRHAKHYLDMARTEFAAARTIGQRTVLDRLEAENANLLSAWRRSLAAGPNTRVWKAAEPLFYTFVLRARYRDAEMFFRERTEDPSLNLYFDSMLANCLTQQGELEAAKDLAQRALEASATPQLELARAHAYQALGIIHHARGQFDDASRRYNEALAIRRSHRDAVGCHYSTLSLAILNIVRREPAEARTWIKQSADCCKRSGNTTGRMQLHFHAGELAAQEGRREAATTNFLESLRIEEDVGHAQYRARVLTRLGGFSAENGDRAQALAYLNEAYAVASEFGDRRHMATSLAELGAVLRGAGELDDAKRRLVQSIRISLEIGVRPILAQALVELAQIELGLGNHERAGRLVGVLGGNDLGPLQGAYDAVAAALPEGIAKQRRRKSPESAAREIVDETDYLQLML